LISNNIEYKKKKIKIPESTCEMITFVSDVLFNSDSFWGNTDLQMLAMILATCKAFRKDLLESTHTASFVDSRRTKKAKLGRCLLEHAVSAIIKGRPFRELWRLRFSQAKDRFSLPVHVMIKHCQQLAVEDKNHLDREHSILVKKGFNAGFISFVDALRLTIDRNGGLKLAMKRRNEERVKVMDAAGDLVAKLEPRLVVMNSYIIEAIELLRQEELHKMSLMGVKNRTKLKDVEDATRKTDIRILSLLKDGVRYADILCGRLRLEMQFPREHLVKQLTQDFKTYALNLAKRYKSHQWRSVCLVDEGAAGFEI
jgi:hypothetical protein